MARYQNSKMIIYVFTEVLPPKAGDPRCPIFTIISIFSKHFPYCTIFFLSFMSYILSYMPHILIHDMINILMPAEG